MVGCIGGKEPAGAYGAPDRASVEVRAGEGACEAVRGLLCAYSADVGEGPVEHSDLGKRCDANGDELDGEELAWGDLLSILAMLLKRYAKSVGRLNLHRSTIPASSLAKSSTL